MTGHLSWVAQRLYGRPLLVHEGYAATVSTVLSERLGVAPMLQGDQLELVERPVRGMQLGKDGVLTIPVVGGLYHRGDELDAMSGSMSYTLLNNRLKEAMGDPDVRGILLDIDSPGGEAGALFEFADVLHAASKVKPIYAVANTLAASAAYAIGASATKFFATPSAAVGSIGVVTLHLDQSKAMEKRGIVPTFIKAGAKKTQGNSLQPLSTEDVADIQAMVDDTYKMFVDLVAARRPMSADEIRQTEARVFSAGEAEKLGLIDGVLTYEGARGLLSDEVNPRFRVRVTPTGQLLQIKEN